MDFAPLYNHRLFRGSKIATQLNLLIGIWFLISISLPAMTRKKVKLTYITNDAARKATFKKRKKGLIKKVHELSTLCDVQACAVIYSPFEAAPEVWPSPAGVQRVVAQFKDMPEVEQSKKMVNQETFLRQRIAKVHEQLKKQRKENREKEMTRVMFASMVGVKPLEELSMVDLNELGWLIDHNLKEICSRLKTLKEVQAAEEADNDHKKNEAPADAEADGDGVVPQDVQMGNNPFEEQNQVNSVWSNNSFFP